VTSPSVPAHSVYVHRPFKAGLPRLRTYFASLWRRREFAFELAKADVRTQNASGVLGQLWLVLNPLFMAAIYYMLVVIVSGGRQKGADYLAHLIAGLFAYHFVSGAMSGGARSIVGYGKLIANHSFPRLLLPLAAINVSLRKFLPTLVVYLGFHAVLGLPFSPVQLMAIPAFLILMVFGFGLACLFATLQVYFRDTRSFLPYITRVWMYTSPVLFFAQDAKSILRGVMPFNPLFSLLTTWSDALVRGQISSVGTWLMALGWAFAMALLGTYVFLTRERDFSVRI
jgi:ABC-type polysaccharide/polyol phosphate export permease